MFERDPLRFCRASLIPKCHIMFPPQYSPLFIECLRGKVFNIKSIARANQGLISRLTATHRYRSNYRSSFPNKGGASCLPKPDRARYILAVLHFGNQSRKVSRSRLRHQFLLSLQFLN